MTAASSTATGSATDSREDVVDRLQSRLDQLKLKVFKINQVSYGSLQGLVDSGATHPLRLRRLEEGDETYKRVSVRLANGETTSLQVTPGGIMVTERVDVEPILPMGQLSNWSMTLVAKFAVRMVTWRSFIHAEVYCQCKTKRDVLNYHELLPWIWSRKWRWLEVRELWEAWSLRKSRSGWRSWSKVTLFSVNFQTESKTGFWSMWAMGKICQSIAAKGNVFSVMAVWCIYMLEKMMGSLCLELSSSKGETPINYLKLTWNVGSPTTCWMMLERTLRLLCAVMHDKVDAFIAGPNCRTRSVLWHYPKENAPRPIRAWHGGEHGLSDLSPAEQRRLDEDDVLMWRFIFLWMVATYVRQAQEVQKPAGFLLEQPASPRRYMPECVSFWDTKEWRKFKEEFNFEETTFSQDRHGGAAIKPWKVKHPLGGVLSVDTAGPFVRAYDAGGYKAAYPCGSSHMDCTERLTLEGGWRWGTGRGSA